MKRTLKTLALVTFYILLISIMVVTVYEIHNETAQDKFTSYYTRVLNNIYIDEKADVNDAEILDSFIETLPPIFIKEFRKDWRLVIEDSIPIPCDWPDNIAISGYTDWHTRTIVIKKHANPSDMLDVFAHEIGHCFDFEYGSVSYSSLFREFYELYNKDFDDYYTNSPPGYSTSTPVEFFATCFKEYLLYPEHLNTEAPKAYIFIDSFYKDIQKLKHTYLYDLGTVSNTMRRMVDGEIEIYNAPRER
jgi:hypothetical protein